MSHTYPYPDTIRNCQFSASEKLDAIHRIRSGESKASVARHIDVPESTLRGWCKKEDKLRCDADNVAVNGFKKSKTMPDTVSDVVTKTHIECVGFRNSDANLGATTRSYLESSVFGPNTNKITSNPSLITQLCNRPNLAMLPKTTELPNNMFIQQSNYSVKENSDQELGMINNLKKPSVATLHRSTTEYQQFLNRNNIYLAMHASGFNRPAVLPQHESECMITPSMVATPQQRTISSTIPLSHEGNSFLMSQKCNQKLISVEGDKSPSTNHSSYNHNFNKNVNGRVSQPNKRQKTEYSIRSLSVSSSSPVPDRSEDIDQKRVVLDDIFNYNNIAVKNDPNIIGVPEAVVYAEKFFEWFETYSDPTITSQDFMQFERLLSKVRNIAERENKPVCRSSKIRRTK